MSLALRLFNREAPNEVAFQELIDGTGKDKPGYEKTRSCGEQVPIGNVMGRCGARAKSREDAILVIYKRPPYTTTS
jgi:hypothetical protein